jgi:hypothetical protein
MIDRMGVLMKHVLESRSEIAIRSIAVLESERSLYEARVKKFLARLENSLYPDKLAVRLVPPEGSGAGGMGGPSGSRHPEFHRRSLCLLGKRRSAERIDRHLRLPTRVQAGQVRSLQPVQRR